MPDLDRFVIAQAPVIGAVLDELRAGRKQTHWMWFVFPQLTALGRSPTAKRYGLADVGEARDYMAHPLLGPRLLICTRLVNAAAGKSAHEIFGSPDDLKFRSCVTLFHHAAPDEGAFAEALQRYYGGVEDERTVELMGA
jgi:uncharacterized protein (DUF1810 family)